MAQYKALTGSAVKGLNHYSNSSENKWAWFQTLLTVLSHHATDHAPQASDRTYAATRQILTRLRRQRRSRKQAVNVTEMNATFQF